MNTNHPTPPSERPVPALSTEDFLALGAESTAFVKAMEVDGRHVYGIFSSFGQPLGYADSLAAAHATVRQNDLDPVSVH